MIPRSTFRCLLEMCTPSSQSQVKESDMGAAGHTPPPAPRRAAAEDVYGGSTPRCRRGRLRRRPCLKSVTAQIDVDQDLAALPQKFSDTDAKKVFYRTSVFLSVPLITLLLFAGKFGVLCHCITLFFLDFILNQSISCLFRIITSISYELLTVAV